MRTRYLCLTVAVALVFGFAAMAESKKPKKAPANADKIQCANLIYAGSKSSVCFSDKFLRTLDTETHVDADSGFTPVKVSSDEIFNFPFAIMTGEGTFSLFEKERTNLKHYLNRGGFVLASAGCSSKEWDASFRREFRKIFPEGELKRIPKEHPIYQTVFDTREIRLKNGGTTLLEGFEVDGRIVLVYSPEGLNDTSNVDGCCCCGGNEVRNSERVNTNVLTYALTH